MTSMFQKRTIRTWGGLSARAAAGWALCLGVLLASAALAGPARADFGVSAFTGEVANQDGSPATQAGAHPYRATVSIEFNQHATDFGRVPDADAKDITVDLPPGLIGNPNATPKCDEQQIQDPAANLECAKSTQVGISELRFTSGTAPMPIYNMVPPPGIPAQFAFNLVGVLVHMNARLRTDGSYGLSIDVRDISQAQALLGTRVTFWGVPASRAHDGERNECLISPGVCPSDAPERPFLTNPMNCEAGPLTTTLFMSPWVNPAQVVTASFDRDINGVPMEVDRCDLVPFDGSLRARPALSVAGQPSGYTFDLTIPQNENPTGLAVSTVRKVSVLLPEGMNVSPSSAAGLEGCADEAFGLNDGNVPRCPNGAKIGTLEIDTPLLDQPLTGTVILARPLPTQLLRLFLYAEGSGVMVKLRGDVTPDPVTGRLTATFDNNPQLPFENLHLEFKGGPRAALSNPPVQGTYTTSTTLTSWSGKTVVSTDSFTIDQGPTSVGFTPDFFAGMMNPAGGSASTFSLRFGRGDDDQMLNDITVAMPPGLTGMISQATLCSEVAANAGTCGEHSRIGTVTTGAGPGTNPFHLPGRAYITGPYKGAPFGMSIVVPAIAGPFDLGTVVVRAAIHVNKRDASLRVVSDPMPSILQGIPLQIRSVQIAIDRRGFMLNPTSCSAKRIDARIASTQAAGADVSSRFQAADCANLPFQPRMSIKVGKRGRTSRDQTVPLEVTLAMPRGNANNRGVEVTLPDTINARLRVVNQACSLAEFEAERCGARAQIGTAVAVTPLLRDPLRGPVYFVRSGVRRLPDIMVALRGQVAVDLTGKIRLPRLLLSTNFDAVPDVPITKFTMKLVAGRQGPVGAVQNLCTARARRDPATLRFRGQNGRLVTKEQKLRVIGCGRGSGRGRRRTGRGRANNRRASARRR